MGRTVLHVSLAALFLGLSFPTGWAQEKPAQQQKQEPATKKPKDTRVAPPAAPLPPLSTEKAKGQTPAAGQTESTSSGEERKPLSGVEEFTLNTMGRGHSYFYPLFQVAESGDTNTSNQYGSSTFESVSTISGAFSLNHVWSRYNFAAHYTGSGFIYNQDPSLSSSAHSFSLAQTIYGKRSSFLLADAVSYLPESSFGYARFSGFGNLGGGLGSLFGVSTSGLNGMYFPDQSILTGDSRRVSNTAMGQYNYQLSPLSSVTFFGSYGLLRFPDSGFIDSNAGIFGLGYDHAIGRKDSIDINYTGSVYRFGNLTGFNFTNHVVALMYGHQVSQLLSLRLGGGPQVNVFGNGSMNETAVSWYATASLDYRLPRTWLSLRYWHYTSAGAGVYRGAQTDRLQLGVGRQITRMWSGVLGLGYSYNKDLQSTSTSPTFNTWYASANLQRPLGPYMSMFLSYNLQQQLSSVPYCTVTSCGSFYTRHYFSLGFNWHPRSVEFGGIK